MVQVLLTDRLRSSVRLFHHVLVYMGDLHLVHPALNLSTLDGATRKIDYVLLEHGGLPHVLPLAVHLGFFCGQVEGTILRCSYSFSFIVKPQSCLKVRGLVVVGGGGLPTAF